MSQNEPRTEEKSIKIKVNDFSNLAFIFSIKPCISEVKFNFIYLANTAKN